MLPNYPGDDVAQRAFDVMMRRGWEVRRESRGWIVPNYAQHWYVPMSTQESHWPDPFTALVMADEWFKANVEKND